MTVIEVIELLRQLEGVLGQVGRLGGGDALLQHQGAAGGAQPQRPDIYVSLAQCPILAASLSLRPGWDGTIPTLHKYLKRCKYPPAEPVALRLLAPQRGLFATVRSKSKNKSKNLVLLSSLPQHGQFEGEHTPGILKVRLPPRQSRGISLLD